MFPEVSSLREISLFEKENIRRFVAPVYSRKALLYKNELSFSFPGICVLPKKSFSNTNKAVLFFHLNNRSQNSSLIASNESYDTRITKWYVIFGFFPLLLQMELERFLAVLFSF